MSYVKNMEELQVALARKDAEIIVEGEFVKTIEPVVKLKSLSKTKIATIIAMIPVLMAAQTVIPWS